MSDNAPAEKSPDGEPGVEDIRSQWQKLDAGASAPKNLQDWQMRQRALKEEERKKKMNSEAILHNYRGDVKESDTKLAALREEERKKKMNAETMLHNYRGHIGNVQSGAKGTGASGVTADAVASAAGRREDIMSGDVAGIAGSFDVSRTEDEPITGTPISLGLSGTAEASEEAMLSSSGGVPGTNNEVFSPHESESAPAVPASEPIVPDQSSLEHDTGMPVEPVTTEELGNSGVLVKEPVETAQLHNDDWVTITPPDEKSVPTANPNEGTDQSTSHASPAVVTQTQPIKQTFTNQPFRVDVGFSFGVLSNATETQPSLSKYIQAIEEVVQRTLCESNINVTYNSSYPPFINSVEKDDSYLVGRSDIVRYVVHGSIPVTVSAGNDVRIARDPIRSALKAAVKDGTFLSTALRYEKAGVSA